MMRLGIEWGYNMNAVALEQEHEHTRIGIE